MAHCQSSSSGTSPRRHIRDHHDVNSHSSRHADSEWESREAMRQRELEEARARTAQMEKTMKWWSDCTANWREKWSKVRNERNSAREEAKVLKTKLEAVLKDVSTHKHQVQEVEFQNDQLKKEMEKLHMILLKHAGQFDQKIISILESDPLLRNSLGLDGLLGIFNNVEQSQSSTSRQNKDQVTKSPIKETSADDDTENSESTSNKDIEEYVLQGAVPKHAVELYKETSMMSLDRDIAKLVAEASNTQEKMEKRQSSIELGNKEYPLQKISRLQSRLDEAIKRISAEREEKSSLHRAIEKMESEVIHLRLKCKELEESRAEVINELLDHQKRYRDNIGTSTKDLMDDSSGREATNRQLSELRTELERLQLENAAEWGKRECLETEKISLERENKQLRNELKDVQEKIESRRGRPISISDTDTKVLQQELLDKNREMAELKHSYAKLKKMYCDKTTELSHSIRRSEQYETEVKRVRARVEELKKELSTAQDDVDIASNNVRKLQRTNKNLIEQLDIANIQLEHLKNRLASINISENFTPDAVEIKDNETQRDYGDDNIDDNGDKYEDHRIEDLRVNSSICH